MKVIIVTPYFYPKIGGVENHSFKIAKGLRSKGHDILILTTNYNSPKEYLTEKVQGLRVIRLPFMFKISNSPFHPLWVLWVRRIIKSEVPDVIHAHSPVPGLADVAFLVKGNTKFIVKYHSGSMAKGGGIIDSILRMYERTFLKHMILKANGVAAVYPTFVEKLINDERSVHFIPPGVDINTFKPMPQVLKEWDLLYVGRMDKSSKWKGIDILLEATKICKQRFPRIKLNLVGSGDDVMYLKQKTRQLGLESNVVFTGPLHGKELVNAYNASKILVLPSYTEAESFGNALIEAMACGLAVIGSNVGGIPNVIHDAKNGYLVPPKDSHKLAERIKYLLLNPSVMKRLGSAGHKYVTENLSTDALIDSTEDMINIVVSGDELAYEN